MVLPMIIRLVTQDDLNKLDQLAWPEAHERPKFTSEDWKGRIIVFKDGVPIIGFNGTDTLHEGNPMLDVAFPEADGFELVKL